MTNKSFLGLLKRYGMYGFIRLLKDTLLTKIFFGCKTRIVRYPYYIRKDGIIKFGRNFTCGVGLRIDAFNNSNILISDNVQINDYVHIASIKNIIIGKDTLIASKVFITDHNHGILTHSDERSSPDIPPADRPLEAKPVTIGERVWIGENVTILPGTTIGNGVIIGANSVVRGHVPDNVIIAGVPAKIIKRYNFMSKIWEKIY